MKAITKTEKREGLSLIDVGLPEISADDEVLVEIKAASICGTDIHIYDWDPWALDRIKNLPLILGHELAGVVLDRGAAVKGLKIGDRVAFESHIFCGQCPTCLAGACHLCDNLKILGIDRDGGFAKCVNVPEKILFKIDFPLNWEIMALMEPFGNALYCASPEGKTLAGKTAVIMGDGPAGILAGLASKALKAENVLILGINPYRLRLINDLNLEALNICGRDIENIVFDKTGGKKFDIGLEMSGSGIGFRDLLKLVRKGGRVSAFGLIPGNISLNLTNQVIFQGLTINGINGRIIPETWNLAINLLMNREVNLLPLITHRFDLSRFQEAFAAMKKKECGKVILLP